MTWNHRVMRRVIKMPSGRRETFYDIREVFYNGRGKPDTYTADGIAPGGNALAELREELSMMLAATYRPIFQAGAVKRGRRC